MIMDMNEIKAALADRNLREVSRRSGVAYHTLWLMAREKHVPSYVTVKAISDYLLAARGRVSS
jgi:hypothetical protein